MFARRREQLERDAERIGALAVRGDVTNAADLERLVAKTLEAFGGIDIVVWNSGGPPPGKAAEITDDSLEAAFELLLLPAVRLVRLCLPHLERSPAGRIICITSAAVKEPVAAPRALEHDPARRSPAGRRRSPASSARRESPSTASPRAASTRRA